MARIKGIDVVLIEKAEVGKDPFGHPIYDKREIVVENVIVSHVGSMGSDAIVSSMELDGKHVEYVLGIPKGDTHKWESTEVRFFGERFRTVGKPLLGMEHMMPLEWNKRVLVEAYE